MASLPHARLRTRILFWSLVPTTIILLAVAGTIYYAYQRVTQDLVVGRNQQLMRLSAGQLATDLNEYVGTLASLTHSPDLVTGNRARQSVALAQAANQLTVFDGGALILDPHGVIVATQPERPELLGQDWSERSFFRQVLLHSGTPTFSDMLPGGQGDAPALAVAVPILNDQGEFRGTLVGLFRLGARSSSTFYGAIVKLRLGGSGSTYLVDSAGRVLYHPDGSRIGDDLQARSEVQQVLKGQVGTLRTRNLEGSDVLVTFAPVPGTPWGLINEERWAGLLASSRGYGQFLYLLLALGIVIPTLVVTFGVKRITDPLQRLTAAAREIAGGMYGQQISVRTGDELEELSAQFNRMSAQLQGSYTQLEQRVAARTRELGALNAIANVASRSLNLEEILRDALDKTLQVLGMESGGAYGLNDEGTHLSLLAQRNLSEGFVRQASPRPLKGTVVEQVALVGQPIVWRLEDYPESMLKPWLERAGTEQVICVPLMAKGRLVGALSLGTRSARAVAPEELALLAAIGQQIGVAVENAYLYQQAEAHAAIAERTRLARELHDSVTQSLYSITLYAEAAATLLTTGDAATAARHLRALRDTAQEALREMRLLIYELRPPMLEQGGLADALQARLDAVEGRGGIKSELHVTGEDHLARDVQKELYQIAQEALNNVLKHAHAQRVDVDLIFSEAGVQLEVRDDGQGFDAANPPRGGMGLAGIRERAQKVGGDMILESTPGGGGTRVRVQIPLGPQPEQLPLQPVQDGGAR